MTTSTLLQAMWWMRRRETKSSSLPPAIQMPQMHPTAHQHLSPRHQMLHWNPQLNLNHKIWFHSHPNKSQLMNHSKRKTLNQNWVEADVFKRNHLVHTSEWPMAYPHLMQTLWTYKLTYLRMKRTGKQSYPQLHTIGALGTKPKSLNDVLSGPHTWNGKLC